MVHAPVGVGRLCISEKGFPEPQVEMHGHRLTLFLWKVQKKLNRNQGIPRQAKTCRSRRLYEKKDYLAFHIILEPHRVETPCHCEHPWVRGNL